MNQIMWNAFKLQSLKIGLVAEVATMMAVGRFRYDSEPHDAVSRS